MDVPQMQWDFWHRDFLLCYRNRHLCPFLRNEAKRALRALRDAKRQLKKQKEVK